MKKLLASIMAAIMLCGSMGVTASDVQGVHVSQAQTTTTQKKIITKKKELTEKQLIQLADDSNALFKCKELSTCALNEKTNALELEVVKAVSSELQKKIDAIKKKYGISVNVKIVDDYEDLPIEYEEPEVIVETEEERLAREQAKQQEEKLESWYKSLSSEQKEYYDSQTTGKREKSTRDFASYLRDKLNSKNYSYVKSYADEGRIEIGVPSAKAMEQAINVVETYREAKGIKYIDYNNPEKFVNVEYRICKHSYSDILKAYNSVIQDSFIKKNRTNGNIYSIDKSNSYLKILYNKKTKEMDKWRDSSKYADMIVFEQMVKRNIQ